MKLRIALLLAALAGNVGCFSHYSRGPAFHAVTPPEGFGVVYVYRPRNAYGAASSIEASLHGRYVSLCSGSYAAIIVPPGKQTVDVAITSFNSVILVNAVGITGVAGGSEKANARAPVTLDVSAGQSYFVRAEFDSFQKPPITAAVPPPKGLDQIGDLHVIPGGRARWPVVMAPAP